MICFDGGTFGKIELEMRDQRTEKDSVSLFSLLASLCHNGYWRTWFSSGIKNKKGIEGGNSQHVSRLL